METPRIAEMNDAEIKALAIAHAEEIAELRERIELLEGLLWYAWSEFNAIRARHGAPITRDLMPTCDERWWSQMTDAFADAIGEAAQTPWQSPAARAILGETQ